MAAYTYKCRSCESTTNLSFSIKEFLELSSSDYFNNMYCNNCKGNRKFLRIFGETSSKITKDKETLMLEIKEDAKKIVSEVKKGNTEMIRQIYGEDV
tara:strand:- start:2589 stop:2879 length:291 start_codon:yes stop_codon:yes gene_type:complete